MESFRVERYGNSRFFAVRDAAGTLVCLCVYRRGAEEVARRLQALDDAQRWADANGPTPEVAAPAVWVDPYPWLLSARRYAAANRRAADCLARTAML